VTAAMRRRHDCRRWAPIDIVKRRSRKDRDHAYAPYVLTNLGRATLGAAVIAGHPSTAGAATAGTRNLRLGHWVSTDSPHHAFAVRFAELVARKTRGALAIFIYPAEQLGTYNQQIDAQRAGTLDFSSRRAPHSPASIRRF